MAVSQISQEIVSLLPSLHNGRKISILLGAGASASSGLPSWNTMVSNLLVGTGTIDSENRTIADRLVSEADLPLLAEGIKQQFQNHAEWCSSLREALYGNLSNPPQPSAMHSYAAALAVQYPDQVRLGTLNFDVLLEAAVNLSEQELHVHTFGDVSHLHGYLHRDENNADNPIFTFRDYIDHIARGTQTEALHFLTQSLENDGYLIIAGTSFRDPDIRQWLVNLLRHAKHDQVYILLARESTGEDKQSFEIMKPVLEQQWRSVGITPIFVEDHYDVAQLICEIGYKDKVGYISPQERSEKLWNKLCDKNNFGAYQNIFSKLLQRQRSLIRNTFAYGHSVNATLWIARGNNLIRYATHDRIYLDADLLRQEQIGFDSPLIAGNTMGSNQIQMTYFDKSESRWQTVAAIPIIIKPAGYAYYSQMPVAVLSFGIDWHVSEKDSGKLTNLLAAQSNEWAEGLEKVVQIGEFIQ